MRRTAERMAARSTSRGTPVKSCSTMRLTTKGTSVRRSSRGFQRASSPTACSRPRLLRSRDSRTSLRHTGRRETGPIPASSRAGREK